ncbi:MAG: bifunctional tetrahydrofolate synthase/dihydrofolate synthase, partial [Burkholderiales bacterium]
MSRASPRSLNEWLTRLEQLHPRAIEMGLDRVSQVREAAQISPRFPIITVGGTNGKGSSCAFLEAILSRAGYKVGLYTSPHLLRYNERVRIAGDEASDADLIDAFERIDAARGDTPLTYFEFGTLAALELLIRHQVDVAILEVGLGGRLDAVNVFDADCAVVVSIGIDHVEYLGDTREKIGFEKAGIFRPRRAAVCADQDPPQSLVDFSKELGADLRLIDRDFGYRAEAAQWHYWSAAGKRFGLPYPALRGRYQLQNAAASLAALEALHERIPVDMGAVRRGLVEVQLPGRFQVVAGRPQLILDVGHNPDAACALSQTLKEMVC